MKLSVPVGHMRAIFPGGNIHALSFSWSPILRKFRGSEVSKGDVVETRLSMPAPI